MPRRSTRLAPQLRRLVRVVEAALGRTIAEAEGDELYAAVEEVRRLMVEVRDAPEARAASALREARGRLGGMSAMDQALLARAYTLYLELVNVCENAFRTHRLRRARRRPSPSGPGGGARVVWVLTAHPTESRSPENIALLRRVQRLCIEALEDNREPDPDVLGHLLHLAWRAGTHPRHKPTVEDEAAHLFSLVGDDILDELVDLRRRGSQVLLRTWVGGDKDGHPGVGPDETASSLTLSRARLLKYVDSRVLEPLAADVAMRSDAGLDRAWESLRRSSTTLEKVKDGDGARVARFRNAATEVLAAVRRAHGTDHPALLRLQRLLETFPGLVIPLELREARGCFTARSPISRMLDRLAAIATGGEPTWYVQGVVVSMTADAGDLIEAHDRVLRFFPGGTVPVIPLFEMPDVLPRAAGILSGLLSSPVVSAQPWTRSAVEVMLGYSDTSKRMGVMSSRLAIHDAMQEIGQWAAGREVPLVFFHGSGGSVGRGGGSVEEQFATWPAGAGHVVKQTLQGEMVERTLASPEILRSQVLKIAASQTTPPERREPGPLSRRLADLERRTFERTVSSPRFRGLLEKATPYARLDTLTIGSRPVRRSEGASGGLEDLRAIPWVLCWTQTRYLLHAWLGAGSAWRALSQDDGVDAAAVRAEAERDPFLRGYLRLLGFTLAKTAPRIWRGYVAALAEDEADVADRLEQERRHALALAASASPSGELLHDRVWLRESIHHRAPMIHPLNLLQIDVLSRGRLGMAGEMLFRETVTGIAAGMLTTG